MKDLELAKKRLKENNLNLVIVKKGQILFEANSHGIKDFLVALKKFGSKLTNSSVADRIVGRAAAMLCIHSKAKAVFAVVMSEQAVTLLRDHKIYNEAEAFVPYILGKNGEEMCPFEKLVLHVSDPAKAYEKLKACIFKSIMRNINGGEKYV